MGLSTLKEKEIVLDTDGVERVIGEIAKQIQDAHPDLSTIALVGIHTNGVPLAKRIKTTLDKQTGADVPLGMIDITLYRDDVLESLPQPIVGETDLPFGVTGTHVVLVDDVMFTGRTVRAALDAIIDFGRPAVIELAVLADRGHREFPIQPSYVGVTVETERQESLKLVLLETGGKEDRLTHYASEQEG
jgi:pyrimidine operon attenuation protein/uracil phosphoribosyltransferase